MKKRVLAVFAGLLVVVASSLAFAGPGNVKWTVHNLSNNDVASGGLTKSQRHYYSEGVDQVCIFCHTPHNAQPAAPLWNKVMPTQAFSMYTSSRTLTPTARGATTPGPESLLCLSCHDGRTAINVLHNSRTGVPAGSDMKVDIGGSYDDPANPNGSALSIASFGFFGQYPSNLGQTDTDAYAGTNLTNDHPISFSYAAAQGQSNGRLKDINLAKASGARFFGPGNDKIECSSCHDPHVDYGYGIDRIPSGSPTGNTALAPFLVMSNAGSNLCFACHDK